MVTVIKENKAYPDSYGDLEPGDFYYGSVSGRLFVRGPGFPGTDICIEDPAAQYRECTADGHPVRKVDVEIKVIEND